MNLPPSDKVKHPSCLVLKGFEIGMNPVSFEGIHALMRGATVQHEKRNDDKVLAVA